MPRVSVIVTTYNQRPFLDDALASVAAQTFDDYEVVLLDDGSTDGTEDDFGDRSDLRYVRQENRGVAAARNHGLRLTTGEYVAFLDGDDVWLPEKLTKQVAYLDEHEEVAAVTVDLSLWFPTEDREEPYRPEQPAELLGFEDLIWNNTIRTPTTVMFRRSSLATVDGFDEAVRFADDYDLYLRLTEGWPIGRLRQTLARHRIEANTTYRYPAPMQAEVIRVVERAYARLSDGEALNRRARRRLGQLYHELAYERLRAGEVGARQASSVAIRMQPLRPKSYFYWLAGLAPGLYRWARLRKHGGVEPTPRYQ